MTTPDTTYENEDLLELLQKQQSDNYRNINFTINNNSCNSAYENRVSFDTINTDYSKDQSDDYDPMDEHTWSYNDDSISNERGRSRSPSTSPRVLSPYGNNNSPSRFADPLEVKKILNNLKPQYPTTPIITHKGCTFTKIHRQFEALYLKQIPGRKPVLPGRVILVYISGRKHTWVALDWVLRYFIEDGDTVVVASAINSKRLFRAAHEGKRNSFSHGGFSPRKALSPAQATYVPMTARMRFRQRNTPEYMVTLTKNIMQYIMEVINPNIIAKVSLELAVGKTKDVIQEIYKLYEPNLVCTASKINNLVGAPLRSWTSSKLTDRLVHAFPLPTIIVPSKNMYNMELKLQNEINLKHADHTKDWHSKNDDSHQLGKIINTKVEKELNENASDQESISSQVSDHSSVNSDSSYDSYEEISNLYYNYKKDVKKSIQQLKKNPIDYAYFSNFLTVISDKSAAFCYEIRDIDPDFKGKGAKLARLITGSTSFGISPHKTKSLLVPVEPVKPKPPLTTGVSFKDIKRNLQLNTMQAPVINIESPSPHSMLPPIIHTSPLPVSSTKGSSLKFIDLEHPSHRRNKSPLTTSQLKKSLSHDNSAPTESLPLEPTRSHPTIKTGRTNGSATPKLEKKGKKRFWGKIFG